MRSRVHIDDMRQILLYLALILGLLFLIGAGG